MSDEDNGLNTNVFHVVHEAEGGRDIKLPAFQPPNFSGVIDPPESWRQFLWSPVPNRHQGIIRTAQGLRRASLRRGAFLFSLDGGEFPDDGAYFRWNTDILFLDDAFWRTYDMYYTACVDKFRRDEHDWLHNLNPEGPRPIRRHYYPEVLPDIQRDHKARIQHIGLPQTLVWSPRHYQLLFETVYENFPNVQYF